MNCSAEAVDSSPAQLTHLAAQELRRLQDVLEMHREQQHSRANQLHVTVRAELDALRGMITDEGIMRQVQTRDD